MARNTNRQGANFELDVMHYLAGCECELTHATPKHVGWRGFGYDAGRSSGSRGKVDVWAIGPLRTYERGVPMVQDLLLIQAKVNIKSAGLTPAERQDLIGLALRANAYPVVAFKATDIETRRYRPHFRVLTGPGPKEWVVWTPGEEN